MPAFTITGLLLWSQADDFYIEADNGGGLWLLDVSRDLVEEVDRHLFDRVTAEGGRTGISKMAVCRIAAVEGAVAEVDATLS